ncbi:MAG: hypothetical protein LBH25_03315 [Fibromonadaceae bacterium]|nr:hypothetical protein [Fibromonadaceae bacterium]
MKKSMLTPVILICSMLLLHSNANAVGWLDIVKEFVVGGIKTVVMPKSAKSITAVAESKPASNPVATAEAPKTKAQPSPEEIFAALNRLESICMQEFVNYVPCAIGTGKNFSMGSARNEAVANARVELANNMGTYVDYNAGLKESKDEDNEGVLNVANSYIAEAKLTTKQLVIGAQQYLSYTYIDEEATEINKGRTVYITTVVMVMNRELFSKALEDAGKEKPLSEQILKESKKGIVSIVKNFISKM